MKVRIARPFFVLALVLEGVAALVLEGAASLVALSPDGTLTLPLPTLALPLPDDALEPDGTVAPQIPDGFLAPDGEITDPTIPVPAPEFPALVNGTPNITCRPFHTKISFTSSHAAKTDVSCTAVNAELIPSLRAVCGR